MSRSVEPEGIEPHFFATMRNDTDIRMLSACLMCSIALTIHQALTLFQD